MTRKQELQKNFKAYDKEIQANEVNTNAKVEFLKLAYSIKKEEDTLNSLGKAYNLNYKISDHKLIQECNDRIAALHKQVDELLDKVNM